MLSGIYALYWEKQDLIYIGLSTNLDRRFNDHLSLLRRKKHFNYKVQNTFDTYGVPTYNILQKASPNILNNLEIYYIEEFDSYYTGLNLSKGGDSAYGEDHPNSKYTNAQIEQVFKLLVSRDTPHKYISEISGVHLDVVKAVSRGYLHTWLQDIYPEQYKELLGSVKLQHNFGEEHPNSIYSNDQIIEVFNYLVNREINLTDISKLLNVKYNTVSMIACGSEHKWLKELYPEEYEKMLSNRGKHIKEYPPITDGTRVVKVTNAEEFCRENNLQSSNLNKVFYGIRKSHKGWRLSTHNG